MAERAGVAVATVSNVLSGRRAVGAVLRARVLAAVDATGYRPNRLAASLRGARSQSVGVMVPDLTNPFFASLVHRLEDRAAEDGYDIILVGSHEDASREAARLQTLLSRQVDGLILAPARDTVAALSEGPLRLPPTVLMDRGAGTGPFDTVSADNAQAARQGCRHLLALGHRDIALVVTSSALANMRARIAGYRAELAAAGLEAHARILVGGFDVETCRAAVEQELRRADPPSAIFAANYVATLGAMKAIRAMDLDFPGAVALLAFDDTDWMTVLRPYLSAIAQPITAMADAAWQLLRARLAAPGAAPRHLCLPCTLAVRESTQRPSTSRQEEPATVSALP
ncbi:LacI family transcriptional regulator [Acidisoma sp. 7E03]